MRLSITVLATLALALVAQGIPIPGPGPDGSDDGNTTPPPQPPSNPTTPPQPQHPQLPQRASTLGPNYTPRTDAIRRGSVGWVPPSAFSPPGDSEVPHPFVADHTPSPGGTFHGFSATHGILGDGQHNRDANSYLPPGHRGAFQPNANRDPTMINVSRRVRTNRANVYDSTDRRLPTEIPPSGMDRLDSDHARTQRGSTTRPRISFSGIARGLTAFGRGRGRGDANQPESSTSNRGRQPTRGNSRGAGGGGGEPSRSSSRGSTSSRRGASADSKGEHRQHPYRKP